MTGFLLLFSIITLYYLGAVIFLWRGLKKVGQTPSGPPQNLEQSLNFSIVIAARNEESVIGRCLRSVFSQNLPEDRYEVIVVNDRSNDRTPKVCEEYRQRHSSLSVITVTETPSGIAPKKHAVMMGIAQARNEVIVVTDADCVVLPEWLATIDRNFTETAGLVQGITAYMRPEGMSRFFWSLQAIDFLSHGVVAAGAIGAGMPLNSNANNFAFRRKAFEEVGGYGSVSQKAVSGDDDFLLQRIAESGRWGVSFMIDPAGAVATRPAPTLKGIFEQRKRWGSKTVNYGPRQTVFLGGVFMFYCGCAATLIYGIINPAYLPVFGIMLAAKIAGEYLLMIPGTALFNQKHLRVYIIPASLLQLPMVIAAVIFGVFGKFSWKGERYKRVVK